MFICDDLHHILDDVEGAIEYVDDSEHNFERLKSSYCTLYKVTEIGLETLRKYLDGETVGDIRMPKPNKIDELKRNKEVQLVLVKMLNNINEIQAEGNKKIAREYTSALFSLSNSLSLSLEEAARIIKEVCNDIDAANEK